MREVGRGSGMEERSLEIGEVLRSIKLTMSFSATFIFGASNFHSRRIWYEKPAPESRFTAAPVSGACVMGITGALQPAR